MEFVDSGSLKIIRFKKYFDLETHLPLPSVDQLRSDQTEENGQEGAGWPLVVHNLYWDLLRGTV